MSTVTIDTPVERVAIADLQPHPRNVREGDVGAISVSLEQFGQFRPIVVQRSTGFVLAGSHTYKAAAALGWTEIDAVMLDVNDSMALRIMLADNRTHDLGRDRPDALAEILAELGSDGMFGTGFDDEALDQILLDLGKYDPGAGILGDFAHLGEGMSDEAQLRKGRAPDGTEYCALHLALTDVQRGTLLAAFKLAKSRGFATQPEAIEDMARQYTKEDS